MHGVILDAGRGSGRDVPDERSPPLWSGRNWALLKQEWVGLSPIRPVRRGWSVKRNSYRTAGVSTRCARSPRVPSMTDSLEVQVLYPA